MQLIFGKEQYDKIAAGSRLYKSVLYTNGNEPIKARSEDHFNTSNCTTYGIVFTDIY